MTAQPTTIIGYDASSTAGPRTGIGVATAALLSALALELPEDWRMRVLFNSAKHPLPSNDAWTAAPNLEVRHTRLPGRVLLRGWQYLRTPPIELLLGGTELHHSPAGYVTPRLRGRLVVNIYDLYFAREPEHKDPFGASYFAATYPRGLAKADRLIACSEFTRNEVREIYRIPDEKICVVPLGVDRTVFTASPKADDASILEPYSIGRPYLLCVTTVGPARKNLTGLLEGYAHARRGRAELPDLLILGRIDEGPTLEAVEESLDRLQLREHVRLTGYRPADQLPAFYRRARAHIIASLGEGFGLPVLEAMACGCPVLVANVGALPEVAADAALMFDVGSNEEFAESILRISSDESLRGRLIEAGLERVKKFRLQAAARSVLEVYAELLDRPSAP